MTSSVLSPAEGEQAEREGGRPRLGDLRSHLTCVICAGYFIDATTIVECLHTFCRSCILRHLEASKYCPICEVKIHRTKGSSSLRADKILQTLVYKMVPDLFRGEMQQRRDFYEQKPYADPELAGWAKGDVTSYVPHVFTADEQLHLRLALFDADRCEEASPQQRGTAGGSEAVPPVRYLRCQAGTPLSVLQKFIRSKFQLPPTVQVQLIAGQHVLPDDASLMDLGYTGYLAQDDYTRLSFRLVQRRKRPAAEAGPNEAPSVKSARIETASPETVTVEPTRLDARLPEADPVNPTTSDAPSSETQATVSTCPGSPKPKTSTTTAARQASDNKTPVPASTTRSSPSPVAELAQLGVPLSCVPVNNSRILSTTHVKLPSEITPAVASASVSPTGVLSVVIRAETMFDPDDEEPTSPQVVQDIIASLDAEEEGHPAGGPVAAAEIVTEAGKEAVGVLREVENVVRRKLDEDTGKQILKLVSKESAELDGVQAVSGETNVVNGKRHGECPEAGKMMSERTGASHDENCKKHELLNGGRVQTDEESSRLSADNATAKLSPITTTNLETSEPSQEAAEKNDVSKASTYSIDGVASHAQSNGTTKGKSIDEDVNRGQNRVGDSHLRGSTSNGVVSRPTKYTNGAGTGQNNTLKASEVLIEKRHNPSAHAAAHCPISETTPAAATVFNASTVDSSVQASKLSKEGDRVYNGKRIPCYAPSLETKEKSKTSAAVKDSSLVSSAKYFEAGGKYASEKAKHVSKGKTESSPDPYKLKVPSPASKMAATSCRTTLKIPKTQYTIHNITKPTVAQLLKQKHVPVLASTKQDSHPYAVQNAGYHHSPVQKPCHQEPVVPHKRAAIHQDSASLTTPLDLSNPSKKTVAADSTSRSPIPSPKPKLQKLDTGKSQNIHSIVDSLANREHISLTAISTKTPTQKRKPSTDYKDSRLTEAPRKPSSYHDKKSDVARKASSQNVKTTSGVPRNSPLHPQSPTTLSSPMSPHRPLPMSLPMPESASCYLPHGGMYSPPLHVDTSFASRFSYDMAMRNLLTLSHMAMAQGGMVRPQHMFPMHPMFSPRPKSHDFQPYPDPSLLRQQSEVRMGAASKKASPTAGTTAPQLRTPTALTSASIQHMEDLTRTVGKRADKDRHSVTVTPIPFIG